MIDCIVPAHNEATTVASVVKTLLASRVFRRVCVVDDGSSDSTSLFATGAGATVFRLSPNGGKGAAMLAGVQFADSQGQPADAFAFFDADLLGLTPEIVRTMAEHFALGFDMVCGLQDHGIQNLLMASIAPIITGQRFLRRWLVEEIPRTCWANYGIETAMNFIVDKHGGKTCLVPMKGVTGRLKQEKIGFVKGWLGQIKMARQMSAARKALEASGGMSCRLRK